MLFFKADIKYLTTLSNSLNAELTLENASVSKCMEIISNGADVFAPDDNGIRPIDLYKKKSNELRVCDGRSFIHDFACMPLVMQLAANNALLHMKLQEHRDNPKHICSKPILLFEEHATFGTYKFLYKNLDALKAMGYNTLALELPIQASVEEYVRKSYEASENLKFKTSKNIRRDRELSVLYWVYSLAIEKGFAVEFHDPVAACDMEMLIQEVNVEQCSIARDIGTVAKLIDLNLERSGGIISVHGLAHANNLIANLESILGPENLIYFDVSDDNLTGKSFHLNKPYKINPKIYTFDKITQTSCVIDFAKIRLPCRTKNDDAISECVYKKFQLDNKGVEYAENLVNAIGSRHSLYFMRNPRSSSHSVMLSVGWMKQVYLNNPQALEELAKGLGISNTKLKYNVVSGDTGRKLISKLSVMPRPGS